MTLPFHTFFKYSTVSKIYVKEETNVKLFKIKTYSIDFWKINHQSMVFCHWKIRNTTVVSGYYYSTPVPFFFISPFLNVIHQLQPLFSCSVSTVLSKTVVNIPFPLICPIHLPLFFTIVFNNSLFSFTLLGTVSINFIHPILLRIRLSETSHCPHLCIHTTVHSTHSTSPIFFIIFRFILLQNSLFY